MGCSITTYGTAFRRPFACFPVRQGTQSGWRSQAPRGALLVVPALVPDKGAGDLGDGHAACPQRPEP